MRNGKKLKGSMVYVREDLSNRVLNKRKELMPQLREARESGKIAYFKYDKLVIKDRQSPSRDIPSADQVDEPTRITRSKSTSQPK